MKPDCTFILTFKAIIYKIIIDIGKGTDNNKTAGYERIILQYDTLISF